MSRIGKLPIDVPAGVTVELNNKNINVKGKLGNLTHLIPNEVKVENNENKIFVSIADNDNNKARALWGLTRSLISNMVKGVSQGFKVTLDINGVGYRAAVKGNILTLFLGFSHEVKFLIPSGIQMVCPKPTQLEIHGFSKEHVGQVAANIRKLRKPEPYKGKGIKYDNEVIYRKEGKKK